MRLRDSTATWLIVVLLAFGLLHGRDISKRYAPNTWLFADGSFYFVTVRAIAEHGRLEQRDLHPESWYAHNLSWNRRLTDDWSNVAVGRDGGWYPKHPILLPLLAVPLYVVCGVPGTLAANVLLNLAFVVVAFLLARRFCHPGFAALLAVALAYCSFTISQSYTFSNDVLGALLVLAAFERTLARGYVLAGFLIGFAIWSRLTNAVFLLPLALIAFDQDRWRGLFRAALATAAPLTLFATFNTLLFGSPLWSSYHRVLVREGGVMQVAAHTRLFNVPFGVGMRRILFDESGAFQSFPLLAPGLVTLLFSVRRRPMLVAATLLAALLPIAVFAKYDWYRPHFLYVLSGLALVGPALLLGRIAKSLPIGHRAPILAPLVAAVLGVAGVARAMNPHDDPALLSSHLREARVFLGETPCDYFNVQVERWECSHFDPAGWAMTGRMRNQTEVVAGQPFQGLWMHPSPTALERRIVWANLPAHRVALTFALGDQTREGPVEVSVRAGDQVERFVLERPGERRELSLALAPSAGAALEVAVRAARPDWKHLMFEGTLSD